MQQEPAHYPRFFDDGHSSAFVLLESFCISYIDTLMRDLSCMPIPASFEGEETPLLRIQHGLLKHQRHILDLVAFQVKARLSNLSLVHDEQAIHELPTEELSIQINNRKMLPVLEVMMDIHQRSEAEHDAILRIIEGHLALLANKSDQAYIDNPFAPFSMCSLIYSSVGPVDLDSDDLTRLFHLFKHLLEQRLGDFYEQIANSIELLGRKDQLKKAMDYSQSR